MANKDAGLNVAIVGGVVTITIGVSALCTALQPALEDFAGEPNITDEYAFVSAVVAELNREEEDGTTPVHKMLDLAAIEAVEQGADGIRFAEED